MDGVNSMTGNAPDLRAFAEVARAPRRAAVRRRRPRLRRDRRARARRALLLRHARQRIVRHAGESYDNLVLVGGFSKAYSSLLAFIACPTEVKDLLKVAAPPYLYSGPSPVASLATVLAGFDVNERRGDELRARRCTPTRRACWTRLDALGIAHARTAPGFPIVEFPLRDHTRIDAVGRLLFERGIYVTLAAYPLVPKAEVGFRVQLTAANTDAEVDRPHRGARASSPSEGCSSRLPRNRSGTRHDTARGSGRASSRLAAVPRHRRSRHAALPHVPPFQGSGPLINLLGLSGSVAVLVGVRWHRPVPRLPWLCFAVGLGLFWLGDVYTYSYPKLLHHDVPFPSIGDAIYLTVYPALMAGLLLLVRRRNPKRTGRGGIDATIMTVGLALPFWIVLIAPYVHDPTMTLVPKLVSIAYPLGDVLLLAAAVSLAMDTGRRRPAFYLLSASIVALLATDFIYGLMLLNGTFDHQLWLDVGWISFYLLWGAAALHPSMRNLSDPSPDAEVKLTPLRLALLAGASLVAPTVELIAAARDGNTDLLVVIGASMILFSLVVARMAGLVRQQERSVARERILGAAGAALVAATSQDEIASAALNSVGPLLENRGRALLCRRGQRGLSVSEAEGGPRNAQLTDDTARELLQLAAVAEGQGGATLTRRACDELGLPTDWDRAIALELRIRGEVLGLLLIARPVSTPQPVERALRSLATQLALALESAVLTEEIAAPPERGALRVARPARQRSDHRARAGRDGPLSEPLQRACARLPAG